MLGYHGCPEAVADDLVRGTPFRPSTNDYDWLGHGIYFWEADPERALAFAQEKFTREGRPEKPAVVGAVIDLGLCLDVTTQAAVAAIQAAHEAYVSTLKRAKAAPPTNEGGPDRLRRKLDCAVINYLHEARSATKQTAIDSVRGIFIEGDPLYDDAGFYEKTHVQIAVRNLGCIKGVFVPR